LAQRPDREEGANPASSGFRLGVVERIVPRVAALVSGGAISAWVIDDISAARPSKGQPCHENGPDDPHGPSDSLDAICGLRRFTRINVEPACSATQGETEG
jgi:hypothetical protein